MWIETMRDSAAGVGWAEFIRQQWRMWIETASGLAAKPKMAQFIRQQWRMWIEAFKRAPSQRAPSNSFASNGECGLKHAPR